MQDPQRRPHPKPLLWAATAALALGLIAFSPGPDSGGQAAGPDRPHKVYAASLARDEGSPPAGGNEINLQPELDTAHAVSKAVSFAHGATLTATGADGSTYTLTLPPNSLLFDVTVTMTPIKALGGLAASGGFRAGVQLEPDGMQLGVPATLDIVAANPTPISEEISFAYSGNGRHAHAHGLDINASRTRFTIAHFSGWAIAGGTESERQSFLQGRIDSVAQALAQALAPSLSAERTRQFLGTPGDEGSPEFAAEFVAALEDAYRLLVKPAMDTAEALADSGDIDSVQPAVTALLAWERQFQLLGADSLLEPERAALFEQLRRIMEKVRQNMRDRCFDQHDLGMAVRLLGMARQVELAPPGDGTPAMDDVHKCLTFKLDFETIVHGPLEIDWDDLGWIHVRALNVPLQLRPVGVFPVTAPLELLDWDVWFRDPPGDDIACPTLAKDQSVTEPFTVVQLALVPSWIDGKLTVQDVELYMLPGETRGTYTFRCEFSAPAVNDTALLAQWWDRPHEPELIPWSSSEIYGYRISSWDIVGGSLFARKTYSGGPYDETTTFDLKHDPK